MQQAMRQNQPPQQAPKYATQITNVKRNDFFLYAEGSFNAPSWESYLKGAPVLNISDEFRIDFFLFQIESKKSAKYSLKTKECLYLLEKTKALLVPMPTSKAEETPQTPAYTLRLKGGTFGGKTPAEVLAEDGSKRDALIHQINYLSQNMTGKYADANRQQIQALDEAIRLFDQGLIKQTAGGSGNTVVLYEGVKTPNNKIVENGLTKARSMKIEFHRGGDKPFKVTIMNCMAPPVPGAKVGAYLGKAQQVSNFTFELSEIEWFGFLQDIADISGIIKNLHGPSVYGIYDQFRWKKEN